MSVCIHLNELKSEDFSLALATSSSEPRQGFTLRPHDWPKILELASVYTTHTTPDLSDAEKLEVETITAIMRESSVGFSEMLHLKECRHVASGLEAALPFIPDQDVVPSRYPLVFEFYEKYEAVPLDVRDVLVLDEPEEPAAKLAREERALLRGSLYDAYLEEVAKITPLEWFGGRKDVIAEIIEVFRNSEHLAIEAY